MTSTTDLLDKIPWPANNCLRICLILHNVIYVIGGIAAIGLGCRVLVREESYLVAFLGHDIMTKASAAVIVLGIILIAVALVGITALRFRQRTVLLVYIILMAVIWILIFFGGIAALLYRSKFGEFAKQKMTDSLLYQYAVNTSIIENAHMTEVWNRLQIEEHCCSVEDNSWSIYQRSSWFQQKQGTVEVDKPFVPKYCCVYDHNYAYLDLSLCQYSKHGPPGVESGRHNRALQYRGCFNASGQLGLVYFTDIAIVGFVSVLFMTIGLILSGCFCRQLDAEVTAPSP